MPAAPKPLRTIQPNESVTEIRAGDCGEPVSMLRSALESIGVAAPVTSGRADYFDEGLRRGVMDFQKKLGLAMNGKFGRVDYKYLSAEADRQAQKGTLRNANEVVQTEAIPPSPKHPHGGVYLNVPTPTAGMTDKDLARRFWPGVSFNLASDLMSLSTAQLSAGMRDLKPQQLSAIAFELEQFLAKYGKDPARAEQVALATQVVQFVKSLIDRRKVVPFKRVSPAVQAAAEAVGPDDISVFTPPQQQVPDVPEQAFSRGGDLATTTATEDGSPGPEGTAAGTNADALDVSPEQKAAGIGISLFVVVTIGLFAWAVMQDDAKKGPPRMVA